jgi:hypothetical protein
MEEIGKERPPGPREDEDEAERLDRNLDELLSGLRVALPGVQVLFAFLLVLPFQQGFSGVTSFQKGVYFGTLVSTALASICLIGPSARHRVRFRHGDKEYVVLTGSRLAIGGIAFLGLAMCGAILLVSDFLFSLGAALAAAIPIALILAGVWFGSPLYRAFRHKDHQGYGRGD